MQITVTKPGFIKGKLWPVGSSFDVDEKQFSSEWMQVVSEQQPEADAEPVEKPKRGKKAE